MEQEFKIRQGNSYLFVGTLKDDKGNKLQLSDYDRITILVTSPGIHCFFIRNPNDYKIEDNKIIFSLPAAETRFFRGHVRVEAELRNGDTTIVGVYDRNVLVEENNISKLHL